MFRLLLTILAVLSIFYCHAQATVEIRVRDAESREPLPGAAATVRGSSIGGSADRNGIIRLEGLPAGNARVIVSFVGYQTQTLTILVSNGTAEIREVFLRAEEEELEEVVITSTRGTRTFADIPTRVEFIAGEELEEKANMKPGDIRMLLSETTGIQTQQTSATTANASIRIQGLDGRYTQILKDGLPLYAGFSGGLGLLQTPPLDLKQVEVIKGSSSTLYGGGAIAGLVNLISRTPGEERDLRFLANGTSAGGLDLSGFYSEDYGKVGLTFFASRNSNEAYDPAGIDLSAIPEFTRHTVNPKVFVELGDATSFSFGVNYMEERRVGGDMHVIKGNPDATHQYFEKNTTERFSTQLAFSHEFSESLSVNVRNSLNHFQRSLTVPGYPFRGLQRSTFSEVNVVSGGDKSEWIGGINLWTDAFAETFFPGRLPLRDYDQRTLGTFLQNTSELSEAFILETGIRADYVIDYGFVLLPRLSLLFKPVENFTSRLGGGFGYKAPTIFTEESERMHFKDVLPISHEMNKLERSYGANWDLNFRTDVGEVGININHLFFYTYLDDPLILQPVSDDIRYQFSNMQGFMDTKGMETNVRLEWGDFKLFLGYTLTDAKLHKGRVTLQNPLTATHRLNNVLMYEVEEKWKVGLEAYYFSRQRLTDRSYGKDYWICGLMIEKIWERFSLFLNFENFLDARQTRFDTINEGTVTNPIFRDIYAPVDGFVVNGGVKVSF